MPRVDGTRYSTAPSFCLKTYSRSMILEMCSAMVASVPARAQIVSSDAELKRKEPV